MSCLPVFCQKKKCKLVPLTSFARWVTLGSRGVVSKTKTEARSTQNSKTKHLNLENEAPIENEAPKTRNHCRLNNCNFTSSMGEAPREKTIGFFPIHILIFWMLRNNADARRCSYFELGLPVFSMHLGPSLGAPVRSLLLHTVLEPVKSIPRWWQKSNDPGTFSALTIEKFQIVQRTFNRRLFSKYMLSWGMYDGKNQNHLLNRRYKIYIWVGNPRATWVFSNYQGISLIFPKILVMREEERIFLIPLSIALSNPKNLGFLFLRKIA